MRYKNVNQGKKNSLELPRYKVTPLLLSLPVTSLNAPTGLDPFLSASVLMRSQGKELLLNY